MGDFWVLGFTNEGNRDIIRLPNENQYGIRKKLPHI
jgi:hypothetical protein